MRRSNHLLLLALIAPVAVPVAMAQDMSLANGSMTIEAGTRVTFMDPLTWTLEPGATVINNGTIDLGSATLVEQVNAPITGIGTETAILVHAGGPYNAEPGGLGLTLVGDASEDTLIVTRGHSVTTVNGNISSVARWYRTASASAQPWTVDATFFVDPSELNGIAPNMLQLHRAETLSGPWTPLSSTIDPPNTSVSGSYSAADVHLTAFMQDVMTSISEPVDRGSMRVWPTVSEDLVHVEWNGDIPFKDVAVYALTGARMPVSLVTRRIHGFTLDVGRYGAGVYLIRVNGQADQRFIRP